jgi:hypothetical protein
VGGLEQLPAVFRDRAQILAPYAPGAATAWRDAADLLSAALAAASDVCLSVAAAAREGGWSYEGLRRRVARDVVLNAGTAGAPLITRRSLLAIGPGRTSRGGAARGRPAQAATATRTATDGGAAATSPTAPPARIVAISAAAVASRRTAPGHR